MVEVVSVFYFVHDRKANHGLIFLFLFSFENSAQTNLHWIIGDKRRENI